MSKKLMHICGNHFCYCATSALQTKLWITKCSGRSVSEAAQQFGNFFVNKPSALCKKPSASLGEGHNTLLHAYAEQLCDYATTPRNAELSTKGVQLI